jgi:hypothetical protein
MNKKSEEGSGKLRQDSLVDRLVPDPARHESFTVLTGFLGKSPRDGYWRLYLTPQLDEYLEFRSGDVKHTEQLPPDLAPLGGSRVWIQKDAPLEHTRVTSRQVQAEFLQGSIASRFLPGTSSMMGLAASAVLRRRGCASFRFPCDDASEVQCRTEILRTVNLHIPACRTEAGLCGHGSAVCGGDTGAFCPTREFVCGQTVGCTNGPECGF